jgi:predicted TIM-barrel fold metal-dependent hydrolase
MGDSKWRAGFARLSEHGFSFDLQTPYWHLAEAADLAGAYPQTPIIVNHTGLPADRSTEGIRAWHHAMTAIAAQPNVFLKISGLGLPGKRWDAAANEPIVKAAIEIFGVDRCMFASNFPVDSLVGSLATIFAGFRWITRGFSEEDRTKLFHDNAVKIYRPDSLVP